MDTGADPQNPLSWLNGLNGLGQVRFAKGVIGKTSSFAGVVVFAWIIIVWRLNENIGFDLILIFVGLLFTGFAVWFVKSTQKYGERNPHAILEGAQLVEWQRITIRAKDSGSVIDGVAISDPKEALIGDQNTTDIDDA